MKSKFIGIFIAISLLINPVYAQVVAGEQKQSYEQAIDSAINRLKKFKACILGKAPCNPVDFAALGALLLFIYGATQKLKQKYLSSSTYKKTEYINPAHWGYKATEKVLPKKKVKLPTF